MNLKKVPAAFAAVFLFACGGGDPADPDPGGSVDFTRNSSVEGTLELDAVEIPAGVTITVTGPLVLNVAGDVSVAGTLAGDCVPVTINGNSTLSVTGAIRNACGVLPADAAPPALVLVGNGPMDFDGAEIRTSGDLEIRNDPTLTEGEFDVPAAGAAADAVAASAAATIIGVRNSAFIAQPPKARDGIDGQNGTDGRDGSNWRLLARGDLVLGGGNEIRGQSGGDGGNGTHSGAPANATGGDGGDGGRISVLATGTLTIAGPGTNLIASGAGGNGGTAMATATAGSGERAPDATARGGDGGVPGLVRMEGQAGVSTDASLAVEIGNGGNGGSGTATAADGAVCVNGHGQHGGHADAQGGEGGSSPDRRLVESGNAIVSGDPRVVGGDGGAGGDATGRGGNGLNGQDCLTCKDGGDGGNFAARGGNGGHARVRNLAGELVGDGGNGGSSQHMGGNGGEGSDCCLPTPMEGGDGGAGADAAGGDGEAGTGLNNGVSRGVTISSGNGGNGGDGLPVGDGGDGGTDNTVALGPKDPGTNHFMPGIDGTPCPPPPPSGTAIAGTYQLTGSLISQSGPCSNPPGITNSGVVIEFDGVNVIVNSTVRVSGPYDPQTGRWQGSASDGTFRETFDGEWKRDSQGNVFFEGTLTFELLDSGGAVICRAVYMIFFFRG